MTDPTRSHARTGGLGALAGAVAVLIPTLPTLWTESEKRDEARAALTMCNDQIHSTREALLACDEAYRQHADELLRILMGESAGAFEIRRRPASVDAPPPDLLMAMELPEEAFEPEPEILKEEALDDAVQKWAPEP